MSRWPIERLWHVVTSEGGREVVSTDELRRWPACGMLGAAGSGKTFEQSYLAELERDEGLEVVEDRFAILGTTSDGLAARLDVLGAKATSSTVLILDALDEVMVPVKTAALIVERWVRDKLALARPRLRLSCRSAVWPPGVQSAIEAVYGANACAFAVLQPLSDKDVRAVASASGVDPTEFVRAVNVAGVRVLSEHPLTLEMLLGVQKKHGRLPERRKDLFRDGVQQLASERRQRFRDGTAVSVSAADVLDAAERLACFCLLSGRDTIDLSDIPFPNTLAARELDTLPAGGRPLDAAVLDAVCRSGLCEGDGTDRFRFAHRQIAEYLAGRRIARLLPHQGKALLGGGAGWRSGVAGPLRETAAFAAMESSEIAEWVSQCDPEVVGLSDVDDASLRRLATLGLLDKFRRHELTDSQTRRDGHELAGFKYSGAEDDFRSVLHERQAGCEDVIECAIDLIESWQLVSMSDELANLMLDPAAIAQNRTSAGYALAKLGSPGARSRIVPLLAGGQTDLDSDLKGLALRCNWPENISVPELFAALASPPPRNRLAAYTSFLYQLDSDGFNVRGFSLQGLDWACNIVRNGCEDAVTTNLVRRISIGALDELDVPGVVVALSDLILAAAEHHAASPLTRPRRFDLKGESEAEPTHILREKSPDVRRRLIEELAERARDVHELRSAVISTPGLLGPEEVPWLIECAVDLALPMGRRETLAELVSTLGWQNYPAAVELWLQHRETEPIASRMSYPIAMDINSETAIRAREDHDKILRQSRPLVRQRLHPPPDERVEQVLLLCKTKDPQFFIKLCRELNFEEYSTEYGFNRFLTSTAGWAKSTEDRRIRITESAKQLLVAPSAKPDAAQTQPLNSILCGYMEAMFLVLEREPAWIGALPKDWWQRWAWYILRELHPNMMGESRELKNDLLRRLHAHVPVEVRDSLTRLVTSAEPGTDDLLVSLLNEFQEIDDAVLDESLCNALDGGVVPDDRMLAVASFVLSRSKERALAVCVSLLGPAQVAASEHRAVCSAVALLRERTQEAWSSVLDFLRQRPDLAQRVLSDFAHGDRMRSPRARLEDSDGLATLTLGQTGELVGVLLEAFPPDTNPHHDGAHWVSPDDSARHMRDRLLAWLGDQNDLRAVEALRLLERKYGSKYPSLRRPRARAERSYRLSHWHPVAPKVVAELLTARDKRLLRSGEDALDGVVAAIENYGYQLRHQSPSELDDLWNQPERGDPTPKHEERVSDKICVAVRNYFRSIALTAGREVQVFRRKLATSHCGAPGSEVDVLCDVPAIGTVADVPIKLPIEVKLANNAEGRTGMEDQLVARYMSQLGTEFGAYVVVWMGAATAAGRFRPLWKSADEARTALEQQAREIMDASDEPIDIRCIVIDASLPLVAK